MNRKTYKLFSGKICKTPAVMLLKMNKFNTYSRDCFDDRICDDLCQVLLGFLVIDDKILFECISKQWQSLIFNKQTHLKIDNNYGMKMNQINRQQFKSVDKINPKYFKFIFKKFKFITRIDMDSSLSLELGPKQKILKLMTKYFNNLKSIQYDFSDINIKIVEKFAKKLGKSLNNVEFVGFGHKLQKQAVIKYCEKLKSLEFIELFYCFKINENYLLKDKLLNCMMFLHSKDYKYYRYFVERNKNTMKSIELINISCIGEDETSIIIELTASLKLIERLKLNLTFSGNKMNNWETGLQMIHKNCVNLKSFELCYFNQNLDNKLLVILSNYKQLKRLVIAFTRSYNCSSSKTPINCELIKGLINLTHLEFRFARISDQFFTNIHLHLPKLKYFSANYINENKSHPITDETLISLSKLKYLEKCVISLPTDKCNFTDIGFEAICNSNAIVSTEIVTAHKITTKTIDNFVSLALRKPKYLFKHKLNIPPYYLRIGQIALDYYWDNLNDKPKNLIIRF